MRDNPAHVRAFAISDAEHRRQALERFFRPVLLGLHQRGLIYGAYRDNALVGICGIGRPGFCQPTPIEKLRVLRAVVFGNPLGTALRVLNWADAWAHRDPVGSHWHLGPVAIEPCVQRQGIGSALLTAFCVHMDAYGLFRNPFFKALLGSRGFRSAVDGAIGRSVWALPEPHRWLCDPDRPRQSYRPFRFLQPRVCFASYVELGS